MANLDTALKRFSGHDVMMPWRGIHSLPDGTIAARDRQALTYLYTGVLATAPPTLVVSVVDQGGVGNLDWRRKKKKPVLIRYSDFSSQEAYAAALAAAAIPMSRVTEEGLVEGESEIEDDDAIIQALFLSMTIH